MNFLPILVAITAAQYGALFPKTQVCPTGNCPQNQSAPGPSSAAAVRVLHGNGCGTGEVVGRYKTGSLVLTCAHVAGTKVGGRSQIRAVVQGQTIEVDATVIMAAYSDRSLTDWAVLYVPDWNAITPVQLSVKKPTGDHYTTGSPRCVWPLVTTRVTTAEIRDDSPLWRWRPNSIGGQSGSAVWSSTTGLQEGLLTWTWGGLGAGQQTSEIYRQATGRTAAGNPRIDGLHEPTGTERAQCENGFFAEAGITELPIWGDLPGRQPVPPDADECDTIREKLEARGFDVLGLLRCILDGLEKQDPATN